MAAKPKPRTRHPIPKGDVAFTAHMNSATHPLFHRDAEKDRQEWLCSKHSEVFKKNRLLAEENHFVGGVGGWVNVRRLFFDDGLRFPGASEKTLAWLDRTGVRALIEQLNADLWSEWGLQDNAVVFWMDPAEGQLPRPMVLDCEVCEYTSWPREVLKVRLTQKQLSKEEKRWMTARWIKAYEEGGTITLDEEEGEYFAVLTRAKAGKGFGLPRLRQAYPLLGTIEKLNIADWSGAWQHQDVVQHFIVGREMKFADALQRPEVFGITKGDRASIEAGHKGKRGAFRTITDIKVAYQYEFLDPKFFDAGKYAGTLQQLDRWGGAGLMLLATGKEWLLPFFAKEGEHDRAQVAGLLGRLLAHRNFLPAAPPAPLRVGWNPDTFRDFKATLEMLRWAVGQGAMSTTTARERIGLDGKQEIERLKAEAKNPDGFRPSFEPKQGMLTEQPPGRPPAEPPSA